MKEILHFNTTGYFAQSNYTFRCGIYPCDGDCSITGSTFIMEQISEVGKICFFADYCKIALDFLLKANNWYSLFC
jgi:hypothetical protein